MRPQVVDPGVATPPVNAWPDEEYVPYLEAEQRPMTHRVPLGQVGSTTWRLLFLSFPVTPDDRHSNDPAMTKQFRVALLRADQECDQSQRAPTRCVATSAGPHSRSG